MISEEYEPDPKKMGKTSRGKRGSKYTDVLLTTPKGGVLLHP
jgi:hypothetical protein